DPSLRPVRLCRGAYRRDRRARSNRLMRSTPVVLTALIVLALIAAWPLSAQPEKSPDVALARLLQSARATLPGGCSQANADRLIKILCAKRIRIGIRDYY